MRQAAKLSECLETVDTPAGRDRLGKHLDTVPFPHYEAAPNKPGFLVCIDESGKLTEIFPFHTPNLFVTNMR
jgi:hypothetical protein